MKKATFILIALFALVATAQAQKYHDAIVNEAVGNVKSITTSIGGMSETIEFTADGRMVKEAMSDRVYDANGYITSCTAEMQGVKGKLTITYGANHRVTKQQLSIMGGTVTQIFTYDSKGQVSKEDMTMAGGGMSQSMTTTYTYQSFDSHGNWTSRTASMGGQTMNQTRTIVYY